MNRTKAPTRRGFWLVESAVAIAVIGIGIVAVAGSQQSWHQQQVISEELATGMRLAKEIREMTLILPSSDPVTGTGVWGVEGGETIPVDLDDLDDLDGAVFSDSDGSGPIDATRATIVGMDGWEQQVSVECVDPFNITLAVPDGTSDAIKIEVITLHDGNEKARLVWIAPR